MSRDSGNASKSKRHASGSSSMTKPNRKSFQRVSGSSSLSSNRNSSAQSEDDLGIYLREPGKRDPNEENKDVQVKKLRSQVKELRHKLRVLEECMDNKEYSLGTIVREKDRALGEVRRLERNNKQLKQQLNDERNHYLEEKEKFCEEMTRYKRRLQDMKMLGDSNKSLREKSIPVTGKLSSTMWQKGDSADIRPMKEKSDNEGNGAEGVPEFKKITSLESLGFYEGQDLSLQTAVLRTENAKLRAIIDEHEERNYELCLRFLRMKHSKNDLRNRFQDLENEYLQIISHLMEKIDDAREEFNFIIDQKFKKPMHSTNAKYLRMVQRNSKLAFENIALRMEVQNAKKELNRLTNGQFDLGRKPVPVKKSLAGEKSKKSKKNVNFKELKSGDGNGIQKGSDTDSNYMSKTSTTDPSTGSLGGGKSNESFFNDLCDGQLSASGKNRTSSTQNPLFTEDILHKLFQRVDSYSNLNSLRIADRNSSTRGSGDAKIRSRRKSVERIKSSENFKEDKQKELYFDERLGKRYVPCSINSKKFHVVNQALVRRFEKEVVSVRKEKKPEMQLMKMKVSASDAKIDKNQSRDKSRRRTSESARRPKSRSRFTEIKERIRSYPDSDKTLDSPKEGYSIKTASSWKKSLREDEGLDLDSNDSVSPKRSRSRKDRRQRICIQDSCGLEEKLDTDLDLSPDYDYDNSARRVKSEKVIDQGALVKRRSSEEAEERSRERIWQETHSKNDIDTVSDDSAIERSSGKSRNRNSISLHDELMEATKSQPQTDDPFWRRELNLHSLITKNSTSSSRTYRLAGKNSRYANEGHQTQENIEEEDGQHHKVKQVETKVLRKDDGRDGSESASPANGSNQGSKEVSPRNLRTTGTNPIHQQQTGNSEVVLRFLMPPATIDSTHSFTFEDTSKEPQEVDQSNNDDANLILPASNTASSSSTMGMADSSGARDNGLTSRTFSAPALLESEWLSSFKMCEMKDCSTNT